MTNAKNNADSALTRYRAGGPKSKNGCIVCKIRRVKCDETKPQCRRCTSTGRNCDGYTSATAKKVDRPQDDLEPGRRVETVFGPVTLYNPSVDVQCNLNERRSFHYFRSRNMAEMPGNFEPYFWDHLVLQFSHQEPTIRHCLIALSAIYEAREQRKSDSMSLLDINTRSLYALEQYNMAMRHLVQYISSDQQDHRVTLVSCLIFVWIEFLRNEVDSGLRHLKSGLQILHHQRRCGRVTCPARALRYDWDDIYGSTDRSFFRLSIQVSIHGSPTSDFTRASTNLVSTRAPMPGSFSNIFESRVWFDNELNSIFAYLRELRDVNHLSPEYCSESDLMILERVRHSYLARLQQWESATKTMIASLKPEDQAQTSGMAYLQLHYTWIITILRTTFTQSEMIFDEYTVEFERIVVLADSLLHDPRVTTTPLLSFDMGVIPPLFFLVLKCRVLRLRKRAIELLKSSPDQEGIWRKNGTIKYAEWKVGMEEKGRGQLSESDPLPLSARIFQEHIRYLNVSGKRIATWNFKRGGFGPDHSEWVEPTAEMGIIEDMGHML